MVGRPLMMRSIVGSIPHGEPVKIFLVPVSAPRLVLQWPLYALFCMWDGAYKRTLAVYRI